MIDGGMIEIPDFVTGVRDIGVSIGELFLPNPVMPASGCFGPELGRIISLSGLGAVVTKTIFSDVRSGNPSHRLTETPMGVLNSVGIPSPGIRGFISHVLPAYQATGVPVIVSVGGLRTHEYWETAEALESQTVGALEINVSCPNLEHDGLEVGTNPRLLERLIGGIVARTQRPTIVKLTPNVTRIGDVAVAAESAGAAALTVANTFVGMSIDIRSRRAVLGNVTGGVSGPAIKPMALRLVWEVAKRVRLPVIGCGGIANVQDALEFFMAGATAVQVGTATFSNPAAMLDIISSLPAELATLGASSVYELIGTAVPTALDPK